MGWYKDGSRFQRSGIYLYHPGGTNYQPYQICLVCSYAFRIHRTSIDHECPSFGINVVLFKEVNNRTDLGRYERLWFNYYKEKMGHI